MVILPGKCMINLQFWMPLECMIFTGGKSNKKSCKIVTWLFSPCYCYFGRRLLWTWRTERPHKISVGGRGIHPFLYFNEAVATNAHVHSPASTKESSLFAKQRGILSKSTCVDKCASYILANITTPLVSRHRHQWRGPIVKFTLMPKQVSQSVG